MATRRTSKKAEAPVDATPASVEPTEELAACPAPGCAPEFGAADLAKFLNLPKGYNKDELDQVLAAAVEVGELYVGRKVENASHEWKMSVNLLAARMYAAGTTTIESFGEIPGKIRYFLELVKNGK